MSEKEISGDVPSEDGGIEFDEFLPEFIAEWLDHLQRSEAAMLNLENDPADMDALDAIFRAFHSIKGAAGFLEMTDLQRFAHLAENVLDRARCEEITMTGGFADLVLEAMDMIRQITAELQDSDGPPEKLPEPFDDLCARLKDPESFGITSAAASIAVDTSAPTPRAATTRRSRSEGTIHVRTDRLDGLIDLVGELVIAQSMISHSPAVARGGDSVLAGNVSLLAKIVRDLQDLGMSMRMVPMKSTFQKMSRLTRDLARRCGKQVDLIVEGEETEIDRNVVALLNDPLVHMLRNSMDHGIEEAGGRAEAGKPVRARLGLRAYHADGNVIIELKDDGRGLDRDKIMAKAVERGLVAAGMQLSDAEVFRFIFGAGFSTAEKVTDISGRGVGLDVVRRNIESVGGRIDVTSECGKGTCCSLRIPLTLAIIDGMLLSVGRRRYVVPTLAVQRAFQPDPGAITTLHGEGELVNTGGATVPLLRLHRLLEVPGAIENPYEGLILVVEHEGRAVGFLADGLLGTHQIVVKSLRTGLGEVDGVAGATILGDGQVGLILDAGGLLRLAASSVDPAREECRSWNTESTRKPEEVLVP